MQDMLSVSRASQQAFFGVFVIGRVPRRRTCRHDCEVRREREQEEGERSREKSISWNLGLSFVVAGVLKSCRLPGGAGLYLESFIMYQRLSVSFGLDSPPRR